MREKERKAENMNFRRIVSPTQSYIWNQANFPKGCYEFSSPSQFSVSRALYLFIQQ